MPHVTLDTPRTRDVMDLVRRVNTEQLWSGRDMKVGYGQLIINKDTGRASYAGATTKQQWSAAQEVDNKQLIINKGKRAAISHFARAAHPEQARVAFGRWSAPSAQYDTSALCHGRRISGGAGRHAECANHSAL